MSWYIRMATKLLTITCGVSFAKYNFHNDVTADFFLCLPSKCILLVLWWLSSDKAATQVQWHPRGQFFPYTSVIYFKSRERVPSLCQICRRVVNKKQCVFVKQTSSVIRISDVYDKRGHGWWRRMPYVNTPPKSRASASPKADLGA